MSKQDAISELVKRQKRLKTDRKEWEDHWQNLADIMHPRRADFTTMLRPGERRTENLFDSTPMVARRHLAASVGGLMRPRSSRWVRVVAADFDLNNEEEAKRWLEDTENRLLRAIYSPSARFIQRTGEVDNDLVTFGTGVLFINTNRDGTHLMFRSFHLKDCYIAENAEGQIDTIFIMSRMTATQAAERYGEENLSEDTQKLLADKDSADEKIDFMWVVTPRAKVNPQLALDTSMAFASLVIEVKAEHQVNESGFLEFPFAIPRWDTSSGELWGRSPGMVALPDANTLNQIGKTLLVAGQKEVDPPLLMADDGVIGVARTFPGGITHFDVEIAAQLGGNPPIVPMNTGANIPLGREMQNDIRENVWVAFFRNVLGLPDDGPRMTATEVLERKEEFLRTIGPVFGQLESDYTAVIVERCFGIMLRAGAFQDIPPSLQGREIRFEYASPVDIARRQIEAAGAARMMELMIPFINFQPEIVDWFDGDEMMKMAPEIGNFPRQWIRTEADVMQRREERLKGQQLQELTAGAQDVANIAATAAQAPAFQGQRGPQLEGAVAPGEVAG